MHCSQVTSRTLLQGKESEFIWIKFMGVLHVKCLQIWDIFFFHHLAIEMSFSFDFFFFTHLNHLRITTFCMQAGVCVSHYLFPNFVHEGIKTLYVGSLKLPSLLNFLHWLLWFLFATQNVFVSLRDLLAVFRYLPLDHW